MNNHGLSLCMAAFAGLFCLAPAAGAATLTFGALNADGALYWDHDKDLAPDDGPNMGAGESQDNVLDINLDGTQEINVGSDGGTSLLLFAADAVGTPVVALDGADWAIQATVNLPDPSTQDPEPTLSASRSAFYIGSELVNGIDMGKFRLGVEWPDSGPDGWVVRNQTGSVAADSPDGTTAIDLGAVTSVTLRIEFHGATEEFVQRYGVDGAAPTNIVANQFTGSQLLDFFGGRDSDDLISVRVDGAIPSVGPITIEGDFEPALQSVDFTFDCGLEGWRSSADAILGYEPGKIIYSVLGTEPQDPWIRAEAAIPGTQLNQVALATDLIAPSEGLSGAFFYLTDGGHGRVLVALPPGNSITRFAVDDTTVVSSTDDWDDDVSAIRFDFPDDGNVGSYPGTALKIDWIAISNRTDYVPEQDQTICIPECMGELSEPEADFQAEFQALLDNLEVFFGRLPFDTADLDENGIPDSVELALLDKYLRYDTEDTALALHAVCIFEANKATWSQDDLQSDFDGILAVAPNVIPALFSISDSLNALFDSFGARYHYDVISWPGSPGAPAPFSREGDLDGDGLSNMEEWANVIAADRTVEDYLEAATLNTLNGTNFLPVAGLGTLAALAALIGGLATARLRRRR